MLTDLSQLLNPVALTPADILEHLVIALLCGLLIFVLYRITFRGTSYVPTFATSLILLTLITAVVMMVIGNNLARAFGLVGAMSIIRFRTAVKDTQDIAFIFLALAAGLAAGVGYHRLAIMGTLFIGAVTMVISFAPPLTSLTQRQYLLQFYTSAGDPSSRPAYHTVLTQYCRVHRLINVRSLDDDRLELSYYVSLKRTQETPAFIQALTETEGTTNVNIFYDDDRV